MRKKANYEERKKDKDKRDGVIVGIEAFAHSDTPLEDFRAPFYEQKQAEREEVAATRIIRPREHPPGWTPETDE
ncbi:MAG: hypothetical protein K0S65_6611 [Labilithrix sp.]|jgi:hypothetical protein|nr:hypothetical protein [Labilithrix sp.]